ncbi:MAG: branched-chain amino acid ABC transporter permease [Myxococcales bacterium]
MSPGSGKEPRAETAGARRILPWVSGKAVLVLVVVVVALALWPTIFGPSAYRRNLVTLTFLYVCAALAWNWLGGYLGQVSFGHSALFGVGGFVSAQILLSLHTPFVLAWIIGGIVAGLYALVWGHPTLRLRGPYFSIATIGVGEASRLVFTYWEWFTGGSSGLSLPIESGLKAKLYYWGLGLLVVMVCASYALRKSSLGLGLLAIKADVEAAADVGISSTFYQDLVLFFSGVAVGVTGAFYASYFSYIEPGDMFGFVQSISFVLMTVIGGVGTIIGPALGAVVFVVLRESLIASYPQLYLGLYGVLLVIIILFEPLGLSGLFFRIARKTGLVRPQLVAKAALGGGGAAPAEGGASGPGAVQE